jgi:hypothetical protein
VSLVIQTNSSGAMGQNSTIPFTQNVKVGSSIVVGVVCNQNGFTSASITDSQGNTYALVKMSTILSNPPSFAGNFWTALYIANNAVGGADTLTVTFTGTSFGNFNKVLIAEVAGVLAGVDGTATAGVLGNGGGSFPSMSLPVTNAGEVIFNSSWSQPHHQ